MDNKVTNTEDMATKADAAATVDKGAAKRRWGFWRITLVALLTLLGVVVSALAVVVIMLGPIVEAYVEKHDRELLGREVTMDVLHIRLFKGEVELNNLALYEEDGTEVFVGVGHFATKIDIMALLDSSVSVPYVDIEALTASVVQSPETFNFDSFVDYLVATYVGEENDESAEEGSSWSIAVENISLTDGAVCYYDTALDKEWRVSQFCLAMPRFALDEALALEAAMLINETGEVSGQLEYDLNTQDFAFDGRVSQFVLDDVYKYVVPYINIQSLEGRLSVDCSVKGNLDNIMAMDITGSLGCEGVAITAPNGDDVFSVDRLDMALNRLNLEESLYDFSSIEAKGYATKICIREDGSVNLADLLYDTPEISMETTAEAVGDDIYDVRERVTVTTDEEVAPLKDINFRVDTLRLAGGNVRYIDRTMHEEFDYTLSDLTVRSTNFELMGKNQIMVLAQLPKQGSAMVQWEGSLSDFYNQSILTSFNNVDMQGLSTFAEHFTAFPITSGNMTFFSQNVITNGDIRGVSKFGTYNFAVGKKDKSLDVEYNLPLRMCVYVLTDRNKHIDVELPISGNLASPDFSLRRLVWRIVGNLVLKVVASPFEWMAGDKQDAFHHLDIDIMSRSLDSEQYARIDSMANTLKSDTTLKVRLTPRVNYNRAVQRLSELSLKMACYNASQERDTAYLDMYDFVRIKEMKLSGRTIREYADSMLVARGVSPVGMTSQAKARTLYGDMAEKQLEFLIDGYSRIISRYIEFQHKELAPDAFVVKSITLDELKGYGGKDRYAVSLIIDNEEVEIDTPNDEDEAADAVEEENLLGDEEVSTTEEGVTAENSAASEEAASKETLAEDNNFATAALDGVVQASSSDNALVVSETNE